MPTTFSRSVRSLNADNFRVSLWCIALAAGLLVAGAGWFFLGRVEVYEAAGNARLEVERQVHPVTAAVAGRVLRSRLILGRKVQAGDVLIELDAESEKLRMSEECSRFNGLSNRLDALRYEITTEVQSWPEEQKSAKLAGDEAKARYQEAETAAKFAAEEASRVSSLHTNGLVAESEFLKAKSDAEQKQSAAAALRLSAERTETETACKQKAHQGREARLKSEAASLEGEMDTSKATLKRLQYDIEKTLIRIPVSGQVGDVADLRVGSFVGPGEKLAAIVPEGELKAVAHFVPSALGRIHTGQTARLRLDGFPWTQYGLLLCKVTTVASEPRDATIQVELSVDAHSAPLIPVQHGLPGTVEIRVDRVTPATLVLRTLGRMLGARRQVLDLSGKAEGGET
jgi:membrane fusion protein (multidrug efflux system)